MMLEPLQLLGVMPGFAHEQLRAVPRGSSGGSDEPPLLQKVCFFHSPRLLQCCAEVARGYSYLVASYPLRYALELDIDRELERALCV